MTQDVQPLTWQKRTNLEEHQQFFSKINEIIDNLAPTVDEAEAAIAQATAAIASANDAIATANAASAAASAAASQAQTAASTVAGYDTRLTAAEGDIDAAESDITALQGRMGTAEGKITAIEGREADYLKKTGAAQTVTSQIMVPTTATGTRDTQIANGTRIQNDLAAYEPMIRNTGNQKSTGIKQGRWTGYLLNKPANAEASKWTRLCAINTGYYSQLFEFVNTNGNNNVSYGRAMIGGGGGYDRHALIEGIAAPGCDVKVMTCINTQTNQHEIWLYAGGSPRSIQLMDIACLTSDMTNATTYFDEIYDSVPESGYSNFFYIIGSA